MLKEELKATIFQERHIYIILEYSRQLEQEKPKSLIEKIDNIKLKHFLIITTI
jgi:hypothetical protein